MNRPRSSRPSDSTVAVKRSPSLRSRTSWRSSIQRPQVLHALDTASLRGEREVSVEAGLVVA